MLQSISLCALCALFTRAPATAQPVESRLRRVAGPVAMLGAAVLLDPLVRVGDAGGGTSFARGLASFTGSAADFGPVLVGLGTTYLLSGPATRQAVRRVARAAALTSLVARGLKIYVGRARPAVGDQAAKFQPVQLDSRYNSFPSGHTALAFALAQAIDDEIDNRPAEIGLYAMSSLVGWSRVRQDKHWASDVVAGAITGIVVTRMSRDGHFFPRHSSLAFTPSGLALLIPVGF